MNDPPLLSPGPHFAHRGRQGLRSTSESSPTRQRPTDDLLSSLSPRSAVDAFRHPSGALKACMDAATQGEQAFALRAAVASKNIQEWLDELSTWPWPACGGPAGFEMPSAKRRKLSRSEGSPPRSSHDHDEPGMQKTYIGSLLASEVSKYETRLQEIYQAVDELDVEEIKSHVLHNHIMPLSRPGTPMSDNRSTMSLATYVKMDDFTALITVTIIQALPNLASLTRLMDAWSIRLLVLRKVPVFMENLNDADNALESARNTIKTGAQRGADSDSSGRVVQNGSFTLSREEFEVMEFVLGKIVIRAGRTLDSMLDVLEGRPDTLPDAWIDRMEALEKEYAEWIAICERQLEWAELARRREALQQQAGDAGEDGSSESKGKTKDHKTQGMGLPSLNTEIPAATVSGMVNKDNQTAERDTPVIKIHSAAEDTDGKHGTEIRDFGTLDGSVDKDKQLFRLQELTSGTSKQGKVSEITQDQIAASKTSEEVQQTDDFDSDPEISPASGGLYPALPILPRPRSGSNASHAYTVVHGPQNSVPDFSSTPDHGTPEIFRVRDGATTTAPVDDDSPPSSPPVNFRSSTRSLSVSFNDMPTVAEVPDEGTPPLTTVVDSSMLNSSMLDTSAFMDQSQNNSESPSKMSVFKSDDQLQQQISEILESVPAKICLTSEPQPINLNPPDFKMPTARPSKADPLPRSQSSMSTRSSRAGTPSFLLAPAPRTRSRQQGNRDIKLYHLSRSNGEQPIKLFIRCVGEHGERVMVRVGGGWADLGEYLKEYASHHRSAGRGEGKVEIKDLPAIPRFSTGPSGSSPPSRPGSALDMHTNSPITPLNVRKTRKSTVDGAPASGSAKTPGTPLASATKQDTPSSGASTRSRSSSRLSWTEEDSSLGMAGPRAKNIEMSEESKAWVESVKEEIRLASGERIKPAGAHDTSHGDVKENFGELGKVGGTKRLFRRQG